MHKRVLSETAIYHDELPSISHVDNNKIKNSILSDFANFKAADDNRYKDIRVGMHQHITWVMDYMRDHVRGEYGFTLIPISIFAQIHGKGENTIKRNHIDPYDIHNSPDFTFMYFVNAEDDELVIEWEDHRDKGRFWTIPIKTGKFVMWNSDLNYYMLPNKKDSFRIALLFNCQII